MYTAVAGRTNVWDEFQHKRKDMGYSPEAAVALQMERLGAKVAAAGGDLGLRGAVGTPEQLREYLRRYEGAGVDQLVFVMQAGRNQHEHIMESIERFGREVLPEFKDRDEKHREKKRVRLEPAIEAAFARKVDDAPRMPDDYVMKALPKDMIRRVAGDEILEKIAADSAVGEPRDSLQGFFRPNESEPT